MESQGDGTDAVVAAAAEDPAADPAQVEAQGEAGGTPAPSPELGVSAGEGFDTPAELAALRDAVAGVNGRLDEIEARVAGLADGSETADPGRFVSINAAIRQLQQVAQLLARVAISRRMSGEDRRTLEAISQE